MAFVVVVLPRLRGTVMAVRAVVVLGVVIVVSTIMMTIMRSKYTEEKEKNKGKDCHCCRRTEPDDVTGRLR
jgi:hypothetical protein